MEKVRPWCGQPSDREDGWRTEQNRTYRRPCQELILFRFSPPSVPNMLRTRLLVDPSATFDRHAASRNPVDCFRADEITNAPGLTGKETNACVEIETRTTSERCGENLDDWQTHRRADHPSFFLSQHMNWTDPNNATQSHDAVSHSYYY